MGKAGVAAALVLAVAGCASAPDLLAGGLGGFDRVGDADWTFANGEAHASKGSGISFLVTKADYRDFDLSVDVYVGDPHNSGVFFRCAKRAAISATDCYEANIFDKRPDQSGRTGAVPGFFTPPKAKVDAANKWTTMTIHAEGAHIRIALDGVVTVDADGPLMSAGPVALQWGEGDVRFRNLRIKPL